MDGREIKTIQGSSQTKESTHTEAVKMKVHSYASKIVTNINDTELTITEMIAKRRLKIALTAMSKVREMRTFRKSKVFTVKQLN